MLRRRVPWLMAFVSVSYIRREEPQRCVDAMPMNGQPAMQQQQTHCGYYTVYLPLLLWRIAVLPLLLPCDLSVYKRE